MKRVELAPGIYHLQSGSNLGLIAQDGKGLLIDTGLDKDAARRALRAVEETGVTLDAVFITHAHADHFGGAYLLRRRAEIPVYAPALEAAMMEHPIIEPLYLFSGAAHIRELGHKFTLAKPCRIDYVVEGPGPLEIGPFQIEVVGLAGHAPNQVGVAVGDVLFCADAIFPQETLEKHKIPFCHDLDEGLATLERMSNLPYKHFAPGHGPAYSSGEEIAHICTANRERLETIRDIVYGALEKGPKQTATLLQRVAEHLNLELELATIYFLVKTTILAALSSLERSGKVTTAVRDNRLWWQRS
jgi:glyoxylase-like metal-dependent hydrolase (beta-lactamase superfamily II)